MPEKIRRYGKSALALALILALALMFEIIPLVQADNGLPYREVKISDSRPTQTGVTYDIEANHSTTSVKCLQVEFCTTVSDTCNAPTGMDASGATKGTEGDWSGWTYANWSIGTSLTANKVYYYNSSGQQGGDNYSFSFNGITNPSTAATTYYARIKSYDAGAADGCSGNVVDSGVAAFAIVFSGVGVSATVEESLSFELTDYAIGFGTWTGTEKRWATANEQGATEEPAAGQPTQVSLSTNASDGAGIAIKDIGNGSDAAGLWSGTDLIDAVASSSVAADTEGYGIYGKAASDLVIDEGFDNDTTGDVAISRSMLAFATAAGPVDSANVDVVPVAGIDGSTPAGSYSDTLILVATPTY